MGGERRGCIVTKACEPKDIHSTWFTRPFFLRRGWGLGTRLGKGNREGREEEREGEGGMKKKGKGGHPFNLVCVE